ncbi:hypothetical protein BJ878DRAFT_434990, partial [Calycina marina]
MATEEIMSIDKKEHDEREGSDDSMDSTPEAELGPSAEGTAQVKRKGGRKPIYATSEERKQRNRQAQAAFRERRTEYIKQLEETIRVHETNLHNLQTAHRSAADECLMLRYKNSLLERILLEKGIDVQAELRAKTGSPHLGPTHMPQNMAQAPTVQRAIMNRHNQVRRPNSSIAPKLEPGVLIQSPQSRPTPPSHASSPTSNSSGFHHPSVITPPASDSQMQHQHQQTNHQIQQQPPQQQRVRTTKLQTHGLPATGLVNTGLIGTPLGGPKNHGSNGTGSAEGTPVTPAFYLSPFQNHQNHYEQLGKLTRPLLSLFITQNYEYDTQTDMVDDQDTSQSGPGPHPDNPYGNVQQQQQQQQRRISQPQQQQQGMNYHPQQQHQTQQQRMQQPQGQQFSASGPGFNPMTQLLEQYDPMLDLDPFGLSASMQFPSQFSFDTSSMR